MPAEPGGTCVCSEAEGRLQKKKDCSLTSAAGKPMPLRELSRNLSLSFSSSISFSSHFCGCWNSNRSSVTTGECKWKAEFHNQLQKDGKKMEYSHLNF